MNPTEYTITDSWQKFTLSGPALLQIRRGRVLLAYNEQPEYDRNAYTVTNLFPIRGVTEIFVKTAANNREPSVIVLGDTGEADTGSSLTPVYEQQIFEMLSGGLPGGVPSAMGIGTGFVVRYSTTLTGNPVSAQDISIRINEPLASLANDAYTAVSYSYTIDSVFTLGDVTTITYTIYFSSMPTHRISTAGKFSAISIYTGAAENISATISYFV